MAAALMVTLGGFGIVALGLVQQHFYEIGVVVVFIGGIGLLVRGMEWLRWLLRD